MANPETWQKVYKDIAEFRQRILKMAADQKNGEVLTEIACQLMELNQNVADLTEAAQNVADSP